MKRKIILTTIVPKCRRPCPYATTNLEEDNFEIHLLSTGLGMKK